MSAARGFALWLLALAAILAVGAGAVHVDYFPRLRTYGVSVGTDTRYCFADVVSWHPMIGCEQAR